MSLKYMFENEDQSRVLLRAVNTADTEITRQVLHANFMGGPADCRIGPHTLDAALWRAACMGLGRIRHMLIEFGADIQTDKDGCLSRAAGGGDLDEIDRLLAAGADIHAHDDSALQMAMFYNHPQAAGLLVARGANMWVATRNTTIFNTVMTGGLEYENMRRFVMHILRGDVYGREERSPGP